MTKNKNKRPKIHNKNWYQDHYVAKEIREATLDKSRVASWRTKQGSRPYSKQDRLMAEVAYKREGLTFYPSKEALRDQLGEPFWHNHDLDMYWNEYLQRDRLLATGQYSDIRNAMYQRNYVKTFEIAFNGDEQAEYIAAQILSLTPDEFYSLTHMPVAKEFWKDKNTPVFQSSLPNIKDFYTGGTVDIEEILDDFEEDLESAFNSIHKKYQTYEDMTKESYGDLDEDEIDEDAIMEDMNDRIDTVISESKMKETRERVVRETQKRFDNLRRRKGTKRATKYAKNAYRIASRVKDTSLREALLYNSHTDKEIEVRYIMANKDKILTSKKGGSYMHFMHKEAVNEAVRRLKKQKK